VYFPSSKLSRSNGETDDRYYYQENDRKHPNDVESLYEELKNVYDWSDGELKSGPRLRGDQRLRYESDDKVNANPLQLQPLSDGCSSNRILDDAEKRYQPSDASEKSKTRDKQSSFIFVGSNREIGECFHLDSRLDGGLVHLTFP